MLCVICQMIQILSWYVYDLILTSQWHSNDDIMIWYMIWISYHFPQLCQVSRKFREILCHTSDHCDIGMMCICNRNDIILIWIWCHYNLDFILTMHLTFASLQWSNAACHYDIITFYLWQHNFIILTLQWCHNDLPALCAMLCNRH